MFLIIFYCDGIFGCYINGGGYTGAVHLLRLRSGNETCFESNAVQDRSEAVFTSMDRAIRPMSY
jgi:hypothetical protein